MFLSDISVKRPVLGTVISLILVIFGVIAFERLAVREYPNINPPIVSITTLYNGASAHVIENRVTKLIENSVSGVEGLRFINSNSRDGRSSVNLEFSVETDIDTAANDVRDKVSRVLNNLPDAIEAPEVQKVDSDAQVIVWLNLVSDNMSSLELTDYAKRYLVDRFSSLEGVAQVRIGGGLDYAMRIWIDPDRLAAKGLGVDDIAASLRRENVELPAGFIESQDRQFTVRVEQHYKTVDDFKSLVINSGSPGYLVRLGDIARIELAPKESRTLFRGNQEPMIGFGIIKQSTANTLSVAELAVAKGASLNQSLPAGMRFENSFDSSAFIASAIKEVYFTLSVAISLVLLVILLFLKNWRATLVPAVTVPISLIATFIVLYAFGFSINILTLLALILSVGLVVDDAIVVLENIHKHLEQGESPLVAAYKGSREVGFAVIATTAVLVTVFLPITFLDGNIGRLFTEFAFTMAAAVIFSSVVALSLSPVIASKLLKPAKKLNTDTNTSLTKSSHHADAISHSSSALYKVIACISRHYYWSVAIVILASVGAFILFQNTAAEFAPKEDRGAFFLIIKTPEGSSFSYTTKQVLKIEQRLHPLVETGEVKRLLLRSPRSFGSPEYSDAFGILVLEHWDKRERDAWAIMADVKKRLADLETVKVAAIMRSGLGGGVKKPIDISLGGPDYTSLVQWRDILVEEVSKNPNIIDFDHDFDETKPQLAVSIDSERAADLGISVFDISSTLETLLSAKEVTKYRLRGEEYAVMLEAERGLINTQEEALSLHVLSNKSEMIPLRQVVSIEEFADAKRLNRYNRLRAINFEANLAEGYSLGEALNFIETIIIDKLPQEAQMSFRGQSLEFKESGNSILWVFSLAACMVFLVLAAQFESYIHPLIIILNVPLAIFGAFIALFISGGSLNIYTQIAMIMLIGLAAKNGILIVEFINQLRDKGLDIHEAVIQGTMDRTRPIVMTVLTTAIGSIPMIVSSGAGSETRQAIGVVILGGVTLGSLLTFIVTPQLYLLLAKNTKPSNHVETELNKALKDEQHSRHV